MAEDDGVLDGDCDELRVLECDASAVRDTAGVRDGEAPFNAVCVWLTLTTEVPVVVADAEADGDAEQLGDAAMTAYESVNSPAAP